MGQQGKQSEQITTPKTTVTTMTNTPMTSATTTASPYIGAGIILTRIIRSEPHFLLLRGRAAGVWSFPKGHPEECDRETPLRTAVRETFEETGYQAGIDYSILGNSLRFGKRPYWIGMMMPTSLAKPVIMASREHDSAGWFTWSQIAKMKGNTDVRNWVAKTKGQFTQTIALASAPSAASRPKPSMHSFGVECNGS
jgi:8-oxo-dGTP pyrophosphatase MutT (NUDIX family)